MKKNYSAFLVRLLLFTLVVWALYTLASHSIPKRFYFENTLFLIAFFFLTTALFHFGMLANATSANRNIVTYYMLSTAFKLLLYVAIIIGYAFLMPQKAISFIANFFILYALFTGYEVSRVYKYFKGLSSSQGDIKN